MFRRPCPSCELTGLAPCECGYVPCPATRLRAVDARPPAFPAFVAVAKADYPAPPSVIDTATLAFLDEMALVRLGGDGCPHCD